MSTLREDQENLNRAVKQLGNEILQTLKPGLDAILRVLERALR